MSNQDKDIQQLFQSKLATHESPVSADVWAGVQSGMSAAGSGTAVSAGLLGSGKVLIVASIAAVIVAVVSLVVVLSPEEPVVPETQNQPTEIQQVLPESENEVIPSEITERSESDSVEKSPTKEADPANPQASTLSSEIKSDQESSPQAQNTEATVTTESSSSEPQIQTESVSEASSVAAEVRESEGEASIEAVVQYLAQAQVKEDDFMSLEFSIDPNAEDVVWDFGDGGRSSLSSGTYAYSQQGSYEVIASWEDAKGYSHEQRFEIQAYEAPILVLPNIFTPDTTPGKNDFYDIDQEQSKNIEDYTIKIYSRDGELVFESSSEIKTWDGKDRFGNPMPKGSYFALVEARNSVDQRIVKQQTIYLKRD